jgi:hypothetical protein
MLSSEIIHLHGHALHYRSGVVDALRRDEKQASLTCSEVNRGVNVVEDRRGYINAAAEWCIEHLCTFAVGMSDDLW